MLEPSIIRIKKRAGYLRVAHARQKIVTTSCVVQWAPHSHESESSATSVGITVTKKVGNAVIRNRVKRRLRAVIQDIFPLHMLSDTDYVLIGRQQAIDCAYATLCQDVGYALKKIQKIQSNETSSTSSD